MVVNANSLSLSGCARFVISAISDFSLTKANLAVFDEAIFFLLDLISP
jgi:hypothetical protein